MKRRILSFLLTVVVFITGAFTMSGCKPKTKEYSKVVGENSPDAQYLIMMFTNTHIDQIENYLPQMKQLYGENDPESDRLYGFGVIGPMMLNQSIEQMQDVVNKAFDYAEYYNIPVYFQLDDQNNYTDIFGNETDIRFWEEPDMCEWTAFPEEGEKYGNEYDGGVPRFWFNWGNWEYAPAVPNFNSKRYQELMYRNLNEGVLNPLIERYNKLLREGKGYLFAGLATGWETHIPDNSKIYETPRNASGAAERFEMRRFGYAALHEMGYTELRVRKEAAENGKKVNEYMDELLYEVIDEHISYMSSIPASRGIIKRKVYSHIVSLASVGEASSFKPPIGVAANEYNTAGFTMNVESCPFDIEVMMKEILEKDPDADGYACAEGYARGYHDESVATDYFTALFGGDCRMITAFGYTDPPTSAFYFNRSSSDGYVKAANKWLKKEMLPDFNFATRKEAANA